MSLHYLPSRTVYEPTDARGLTAVTVRRIVRARIAARWEQGHTNEPEPYASLMRPTGLAPVSGEYVPGTVSGMQTAASDRARVSDAQALRAERPWSPGPNGRPLGEAYLTFADGTTAVALAPNSLAAERHSARSWDGHDQTLGSWYVWSEGTNGAHAGTRKRRQGGGRKPTNGVRALTAAERKRAQRQRERAERIERERAAARIAEPQRDW